MKKLIALKTKKLKELSSLNTRLVNGGGGGGGSTKVPTEQVVAHFQPEYLQQNFSFIC